MKLTIDVEHSIQIKKFQWTNTKTRLSRTLNAEKRRGKFDTHRDILKQKIGETY